MSLMVEIFDDWITPFAENHGILFEEYKNNKNKLKDVSGEFGTTWKLIPMWHSKFGEFPDIKKLVQLRKLICNIPNSVFLHSVGLSIVPPGHEGNWHTETYTKNYKRFHVALNSPETAVLKIFGEEDFHWELGKVYDFTGVTTAEHRISYPNGEEERVVLLINCFSTEPTVDDINMATQEEFGYFNVGVNV